MNHESDTACLAPEGPNASGQTGDVRGEEDQPRQSFLEMLDDGQRGPDQGRQGSDRLRSRLPRRDLRDVLAGDQRRAARRPGPHHRLPAAHAQVQGRRCDLHRAVAGPGLPDHQGPDRRPRRPRPHHPGRRLHLLPHRRRARRQCHPDRQGERRLRHGRRRVHRLRRLRRRLPQRLGDALRLRQGRPAGGCCRRGRWKRRAACAPWSRSHGR